jgi:magnesium/cobalt transport protein CorA
MAPDDITSSAPDAEARHGVWLYTRDGRDSVISVDSRVPKPGSSELLWADANLESAGELDELWETLGIEEVVSRLNESQAHPALVHHEGVLELHVIVLDAADAFEPVVLHCLVGANWIVTLHQGEIDILGEFNKPFHGNTSLGELSGPSFLSLLLDWHVSGYFKAIDRLMGEIDELDERLLTTPPDEGNLLQKLQELRTRARILRRTLSPHREVLGLLSHPSSDKLVGAKAADDYKRLEDRLQQAIDSVDAAREMIVGSFDIFMTRTAQATNEIMKRLTLVSVLLLPAAAIAGVMGMNFDVALFDWSWMFWATIGGMALLAGMTLHFARRRGWL